MPVCTCCALLYYSVTRSRIGFLLEEVALAFARSNALCEEAESLQTSLWTVNRFIRLFPENLPGSLEHDREQRPSTLH